MGIGSLIFLQIHRALKHDGGSLARLPTAVSYTQCRKELFFFFLDVVVVEEKKKRGLQIVSSTGEAI
jgi:hypothetical protein